ncbi:MAG: N-acetylneuraminate synthase [Lentisphaerae bacterium GWF2_52_8]|nr:MAG: N-acetylneuraminate synthase [Lentisphaerae bacterium GWF2_52_8]
MTDRAPEIKLGRKKIGLNYPVYFMADIAANHDGDLDRAKELIRLAAEAGADAVKFQHFAAQTIVSDHGFRSLDSLESHQSSWKKSVFEVYQDVSLPVGWTPVLKESCEKLGIDFLTSPYSLELANEVEPHIPAYKIGSGDINFLDLIEHIARKGKPVLLATGASKISEVERAVALILKHNSQMVLMQCNTNYTASLENFRFVNLRVLENYAGKFPQAVLGLSDHTPGHSTVLGSVALGARVIEKHFTDDISRPGPDHKFSMTPASWKEMVERTRELEASLGDGIKRLEDNEQNSVIVQRRALRYRSAMPAGAMLAPGDLTALRPWPPGSLEPWQESEVLGRTLRRAVACEEAVCPDDLI